MQKKIPIILLLSALALSGCDLSLEPEKKDSSSDDDNGPTYGVAYPETGLTTLVTFDSLEKAQAFYDVFDLFQKQELNFATVQTEVLTDLTDPTAAQETTDGTCGGQRIKSQTVQETSSETEGEEGSETETETEAESTDFDRKLQFVSYCTSHEGLTTHKRENGTATAVGNPTTFDLTFNTYKVILEHEYTAITGGPVYVSPEADLPTINLEDVAIEQQVDDSNVGSTLADDLIGKFEDFKATTATDGSIYTGFIYHPDYGKAHLRTEDDNQIGTTEVNSIMIPSSGKLKIVGANDSILYITFTNVTTYVLEVDSDGDGTIDLTDTVTR